MKKLTPWEIVLFLLSVYVVAELYVSSLVSYSARTKEIILIADTVICALFLFEFFRGLIRSKDKWSYLKSNWIDFVSSIPMIGILRVGRVVKIIRVLRAIRSGKVIFSVFSRNSPIKTLKNLAAVILVLIIIFSLSINQLEKGENPFFESIGNSVWWTVNTTISFGFFQDISPVTPEGRIISLILILLGMMLFGTFISTVTDYYVKEEKIEDEVATLQKMIGELTQKIDELNARIGPPGSSA